MLEHELRSFCALS